jgi:nucleotide-binding universal stress UspA family protein
MKPASAKTQHFSSILCPVDFSAHSRAALQYAAAVAKRADARLMALFVNDPLLVAAAAAEFDRQALARTSEAELRQFVTRAVGSNAALAKRLDYGIVHGDPAVEILKAGRRTTADLVVLGTQGLSGARKLFFGSTTERVLRQATVPVLAVPPEAPKPGSAGKWPGSPIVAALDLGPKLAADAQAAADFARWFGSDLLLVHVVAPTQAPKWLARRLQAHDRSRVTAARAQLERVAKQAGRGLEVDSQVRVGDPAQQIAALAADVGTGLVPVLALPGGTRRAA